jgi:peptide/nickel transport system substrate-binding protein
MKRLLAVLLAAAVLVSLAACSKQGASTSGQLVVGSITDLGADFFPGWTNDAQNLAAMELIHGYSTVRYNRDKVYVTDPQVVKELTTEDNEDGTKTFRFVLHQDLAYNDGTPITAKDYVFGAMLLSSPEFGSLDNADNTLHADLVGFDAFNKGETRTFAGLRLLGEHEFSITVKQESLPFYYELTYAALKPYPMAVIAPGAEIVDSGEGATWNDQFSAELIRDPLMDNETGYRYHPKVTSGPYQLESYTPSTKQGVLTVNPNFKGTLEDAVKPQIQKLILKSVSNDTQMDELAAGQVDLITGVSGGTAINAGLDLVDEGKADKVNYPRSGYGKILFATDFGPTQFQAVRQAISYALNKNEFAAQYSGGYAKVVYGWYGLSQWEYEENREALEKELNHYEFNLEKAEQLLIEDGWTLNADGGDYRPGVDAIRHKLVDGELMPLVIQWANTPKNPISDLLSSMLLPQVKKIGMEIQPTTMEFGTLTDNITRQKIEKPVYHMFNLATGFYPKIDPWNVYSTSPAYMGLANQNFLIDEELNRLANEMKATPSDDKDGWSAKWIAFQKRWNELLPDIPLYSDDYHDFFHPKLKNYDPDGLWRWYDAILFASVE